MNNFIQKEIDKIRNDFDHQFGEYLLKNWSNMLDEVTSPLPNGFPSVSAGFNEYIPENYEPQKETTLYNFDDATFVNQWVFKFAAMTDRIIIYSYFAEPETRYNYRAALAETNKYFIHLGIDQLSEKKFRIRVASCCSIIGHLYDLKEKGIFSFPD